MPGRPIDAAPAQERFSDTLCRGPGRDPRTGRDALQIDRSRRNPRRILVGSSEASKLADGGALLPPLWLLGSSRGPPVLSPERNNPRRVSSSLTRRCRRRMTIQVAGAAAVRRRRLIEIYGRRKYTLPAGWLSCPTVQGACVCGGCGGALGARERQGHGATSLARCTARQAVGC
ncbi:hypothetical protein COCC4DRAFT_18943 [Bipolaris maydis ATCC 48331]|uniref:Uncharacterized protein n=2 Tax=Cochliobolus heterostrophus TaxID=5016 RepID=M2V8L0_COCH5|nr:uncharacterized protein COCC4DRAFT_18943 [Bipolaris maydis ATCC 48331]EMD96078.1 hypothetical protein COCHEDRAFT_1026863 [Bipolaris maydis C5]ENI10938.1 hypothetical protein COCC4DRAFT_18943 [Bipolaris maydis ATCC 48331]